MELIIFFLRAWSILWLIICFIIVYLFLKSKPKEVDIKLNYKTCTEWSFWLTSIYSWFI